MRDAGKTAHLQDREPRGLARAAAFVVIETHDAGASFPEVAQRARAQNADQQSKRANLEIARDGIEVVDVGPRRRVHAVEQVFEEARLLRQIGDVAQGDRRAHDAGHGDEQGDGIERRQPGGIPGSEAPREMQADAGVQPDDQRKQELAGDRRPVAHDQRSQHPGIARLDAVEFMGQACADDVDRAQRNDQRAQHQLRPLPVREPERAAAVERPQGQEEVGEQGAVENGLAQRIVPDEDEPRAADFEHAQRDQAERMVEQMRDDIEEEDVGRPEANPSDHDAISEAAAPLRAAGRWRHACPTPRWVAATGWDARRSPWQCRVCQGRLSSCRAS